MFLSPHLDDVAFSCGGTLKRLIDEQWDIALYTVFTASVPEPTGFALACQLDKGLTADVDYMALRREEDLQFAHAAKLETCVHLPFREAPHRGYRSASELFAGVNPSDAIVNEVAQQIHDIGSRFECIFAPQGLGNHVDHLQTIRALNAAGLAERTLWYQDTPYAIRNPAAQPAAFLPRNLRHETFAIDLGHKISACQAYRTQVPFQFGSRALLEQQLECFHRSPAGYSESFLQSTEVKTSPF